MRFCCLKLWLNFSYCSESRHSTEAEPTWKMTGIKEHPSYHGPINGVEAETKLKEKGGNHYLTRYSRARDHYCLTVARNGEYAHFDIIITSSHDEQNVYEIDGSEMQSKSIFSLLEYYRINPLTHSIDSIGDFLQNDPSIPIEQLSDLPYDLTEVYRKQVKWWERGSYHGCQCFCYIY